MSVHFLRLCTRPVSVQACGAVLHLPQGQLSVELGVVRYLKEHSVLLSAGLTNMLAAGRTPAPAPPPASKEARKLRKPTDSSVKNQV